jgi:hypothetical protein
MRVCVTRWDAADWDDYIVGGRPHSSPFEVSVASVKDVDGRPCVT